MEILKLNLINHFPFLGEGGTSPTLTAYLQGSLNESDCKGKVITPKRPALVICPGGGYHHVSGREAEPIAVAFAPAGFQCFVLDYSVAPIKYPQQLLEMAASVELIIQNAEAWNVDPQKIVVCGFSAGGHLAASYCTMRNRPEITAHFPVRPVAAAILGYSVLVDGTDISVQHHGTYRNLSGHPVPTEEDIHHLAPVCHIDPAITPPTFLFHTATDRVVNPLHSLRYSMELKKKEIPFELHILPEGRHGLATSNRETLHDYLLPEHIRVAKWIDYAKEWLTFIGI